ncbi:hypothetical protein [Enterobacter sp. C4G1]|uniref:hypothetical protein n=1 Tax=Enterobacter sp. C4G1 TaxID=3458724 RepID=UPI0040676AC8
MNLQNLKSKLQPKPHPMDIEGETIYIHRPTALDIQKCTDLASTLILCVKDENGDPIFSNEDIDGRINVNMMDSIPLNRIHDEIIKLFKEADVTDELEKK